VNLILPGAPVPIADLTPTSVGDIHHRAADLIDAYGLHKGSYWPDAHAVEWAPDSPCDVAGAIGVAAGYRSGAHIDSEIVGSHAYDPVTHTDVEAPVHPALAALMTYLGIRDVEDVFTWGDDRCAETVIERIRQCAAQIRAGVVA
jgi:hypothetical protein